MMVPMKWLVASSLNASWCTTNAYPMARGVFALAVTGLGMSVSDTALLIKCVVRSLSWLLVMGRAWGGCA
jgi:hypothetical protein